MALYLCIWNDLRRWWSIEGMHVECALWSWATGGQKRLVASNFKVPWSSQCEVVLQSDIFNNNLIFILTNSCNVVVVVEEEIVVEQTHVLDEFKWKWCEITGNLEVRRDTDIIQNFNVLVSAVCLTFVFIWLQWSVWRCLNRTQWPLGQEVMLSLKKQKKQKTWTLRRNLVPTQRIESNDCWFYSLLWSEATAVPAFPTSVLHVVNASVACSLQHTRRLKLLCRLVTAPLPSHRVEETTGHASGCPAANSVKSLVASVLYDTLVIPLQ